jgi:hypothetical protein
VGPLLSGALVDLASWRTWLPGGPGFPVGHLPGPTAVPGVRLLLTRTLIPETPRAAGRHPDLPGAAAALVALAALTIAVIEGLGGWSHALPLAAGAVAVLATGLFVVLEGPATEPMLPPRLLRRRPC